MNRNKSSDPAEAVRLPGAAAPGPEPEAVDLPLTPEDRAAPGAAGIPTTMGDGREWLIAEAGLAEDLDACRDRLYDRGRLSGTVDMDDVRSVAWSLLRVNYRLTGAEAAGLVVEAPPSTLAQNVVDAVIGRETDHKTYSQWARSALLANGLDPGKIPPAMTGHVLAQLVQTGRAVPAGKFISSAEAAAVFENLRKLPPGPG